MSESIRVLNDEFRRSLSGGKIMCTSGIVSLPKEDQARIMNCIRVYDAFNEANDPYGEHDFGSLEINGKKVFFKIDYFDRDLKFMSPDPSDPSQTRRVMTVMLAHEY